MTYLDIFANLTTMSRPLRIEFPGAWYHVMNRGRRGDEVFSTAEDFQEFINILTESAELWDVKISAYCLMTNHYHLLVQTPKGNLSRFMRHLNGVYTQRYNRRHGYDGQLFRGRYKAILVEEDNYLLELVRYIHRNPVRAGIIDNIEQYPWSSHHSYLSSEKSNWLHKDFILKMFSSDFKKSHRAYQQFIIKEDSEEISQIYEKKKLPAVLGRVEFIDWVKNTFYTEKSHKQVPDSDQLAPEIEQIKSTVCRYYNIASDQLERSVRGISNEPRNVAIYLTRVLRQEGLMEISMAFGMQGYSSASSAIARVKKQLSNDKLLQKRISEIKKIVVRIKSQTKI
ncbi:MAG: transposase [Desulfuromusa sp.]|nr:transposase [Desulfuromusa sp.]